MHSSCIHYNDTSLNKTNVLKPTKVSNTQKENEILCKFWKWFAYYFLTGKNKHWLFSLTCFDLCVLIENLIFKSSLFHNACFVVVLLPNQCKIWTIFVLDDLTSTMTQYLYLRTLKRNKTLDMSDRQWHMLFV